MQVDTDFYSVDRLTRPRLPLACTTEYRRSARRQIASILLLRISRTTRLHRELIERTSIGRVHSGC